LNKTVCNVDVAGRRLIVWFEDRGEHALMGVGEPVRVWAVLRQAQNEPEGEG
jgi:class 3 adenylate cyclase